MSFLLRRKQFSLFNQVMTPIGNVILSVLPASAALMNSRHNLHTTFPSRQDSAKQLSLVSRMEKSVRPYGYLELPNLNLDVSVKPASPDQYPDMNKAFCSFYSSTETSSPEFIQEEDKLTVNSTKSYAPIKNLCSFEIPIKYDVDCANILSENSVHIEYLESGSIRVTTGSGNITSKNIKGDSVSLVSQSGNIDCSGLTQGRIFIQSGSGHVCSQRFQGPLLKVATQTGNISTESVYSDESHFSTNSGDITLKNLHRKCHVKIAGSGNLSISGMDGSLDAQLGRGRHQIQISRLQEKSSVRVVNGSLTLKVPERCPFGIRITGAASIDAPQKMRDDARSVTTTTFEYDGADAVLDVEANNSRVFVEYQDWISSLGLGLK